MELTQIQKDALLNAYASKLNSQPWEIREGFSAIAQEYLKHKNRSVYYMIDYDSCDASCDGYQYLKPLTDENIEDIKATIKQLDPNDEFEFADLVHDCPEAFSEKEYLCQKGRFEEELYVKHIDLGTKYYVYKFKVAEFKNGIDAAPNINMIRICITDEEYVYLIAESLAYKCCNTSGELTLNRLRTLNPEIYGKICGTIETSLFDSNCHPFIVPIYAVEFIEIDSDAQLLSEIIKEYKNQR